MLELQNELIKAPAFCRGEHELRRMLPLRQRRFMSIEIESVAPGVP